jgi:hypothetical protein
VASTVDGKGNASKGSKTGKAQRPAVESDDETRYHRQQTAARLAKELSNDLVKAAQALKDNLYPDADSARLTEQVERAYKAFIGYNSAHVARMTLLECAERAHLNSTLGLPNNIAADVRFLFISRAPDVGWRLTEKMAEEVFLVWMARGARKTGALRPMKWKRLAEVMTDIGIGEVSPETLKKEWLEWRQGSLYSGPYVGRWRKRGGAEPPH